jgi:hypothetical protein
MDPLPTQSFNVNSTVEISPPRLDRDLKPDNAGSFRKSANSFRQTRPAILTNDRNVALNERHISTVGRHVDSELIGKHSGSVSMADSRSETVLQRIANLVQGDLLKQRLGRVFGQHVQRESVEKIHLFTTPVNIFSGFHMASSHQLIPDILLPSSCYTYPGSNQPNTFLK